jgi:VanZ family protein
VHALVGLELEAAIARVPLPSTGIRASTVAVGHACSAPRFGSSVAVGRAHAEGSCPQAGAECHGGCVVVLILVVTLTPTDDRGIIEISDLDDIVDALARADVRSTLGFILESATNVLLFVPFGAALALHGFSTTKDRSVRLLVSTLVEGAQLLYRGRRTTSLDDVFLNSVGAGVGAELVWSLRKRLGRRDEARLPQAV